jgi:hypothetical protein
VGNLNLIVDQNKNTRAAYVSSLKVKKQLKQKVNQQPAKGNLIGSSQSHNVTSTQTTSRTN